MSTVGIEDITNKFGSISLDDVSVIIQHDINVILYAYHLCAPSIEGMYLYASILRVHDDVRESFFTKYPTEATLYARVYEGLPVTDIMDMMPLIDEYIEYVFQHV